MLIGSLRIEIDQLPRHHEVTRDDVAVRTGECGQRARSVAIKFIGADTCRNRRFVSVRRHVLIRGRVALIGSILSAIIAETATSIVTALVATTTVITTLETTAIPTAIITATKITTIIVTTLEVTAITITTVITETTTTIVTLLVPTTTIITETTTTIITETTTTIVALLVPTTIPTVRTIRLAITPLGLTLLVSTTAEFAASSSLFCHGVYPLFLRHLTLLSLVRDARSTTQY